MAKKSAVKEETEETEIDLEGLAEALAEPSVPAPQHVILNVRGKQIAVHPRVAQLTARQAIFSIVKHTDHTVVQLANGRCLNISHSS